MGMTETLMGIVFIGFFINLMLYNYVANLVNARTLISDSCKAFSSSFLTMTNLNAKNPSSKPLDYVENTETSTGLARIYNFFYNIWALFINIYNMIVVAVYSIFNFVGWAWGIILSFFTIFMTDCDVLLPVRYILMVVFVPFIVGLFYILVRLVKSLIPTVGGN